MHFDVCGCFMFIEPTFTLVASLFSLGMFAGCIDAIAGGGGLITIPILMSIGLEPTQALATNKLQSIGGSFSSTFYFIQKRIINWHEIKYAVCFAFLGSILGSSLVQVIHTDILEKFIPVLLILIAGYFFFSSKKKMMDQDLPPRMHHLTFAASFVFAIGFYDGFFGPGTGSFFTAAFISFLGFSIRRATAYTKLCNFITNLGSLIVFSIGGNFVWLVGLTMFAGQIIGAQLGARIVMKKGVHVIRPMIITVSIILALKLLLK